MSLILLNFQSNQLIRLDSDNPLIIGRGNVEGCSDKRVSRNHGRVTCTVDGKIRLEALHCNPCFFTRNGVPPIQQLNKNEEETLNEGDYLGLLPNAFWFKVTTEKERSIKIEPGEADNSSTNIDSDVNVRTLPEETSNTTSSQINIRVIDKNAQCTSGDVESTDNLNPVPGCVSNPESTSSSEPSSGFGTPEFEKTRRLPLWMYEIDDPVNSNISPNKRSGANNEGGNKKKQKLLSDTKIKKEIKMEDGVKQDDEVTHLNVPSTSSVVESSSVPESESQTGEQNESQAQGESNKQKNEKEGYEHDVNDEGSATARPICQYEGNCYRKNPQHKVEYCHPGDSDYRPYEERPICQFGAACYRRNERHRVEFRHPPPPGSTSHNVSSSSRGSTASCSSSSPLPAKRRRKKVKRDISDYGDDDEYDLEDPFINDASSDEYVPSDSEEEEEDLDVSREED